MITLCLQWLSLNQWTHEMTLNLKLWLITAGSFALSIFSLFYIQFNCNTTCIFSCTKISQTIKAFMIYNRQNMIWAAWLLSFFICLALPISIMVKPKPKLGQTVVCTCTSNHGFWDLFFLDKCWVHWFSTHLISASHIRAVLVLTQKLVSADEKAGIKDGWTSHIRAHAACALWNCCVH